MRVLFFLNYLSRKYCIRFLDIVKGKAIYLFSEIQTIHISKGNKWPWNRGLMLAHASILSAIRKPGSKQLKI